MKGIAMSSWYVRGAANASRIGMCLLVCLGTAAAQEVVVDEEPEEIVVTATRIETELEDVGSSVTVITGEELQAKQYEFVLEALREVPGLSVRRAGGRGSQTSIFIRGTDSDHTLLLVDGIQVHDPSSPTGAAEISHMLVENIERIEIVRGPQSTLYGSDAIGGVINIITKKGTGEPAVTVTAEAGSEGMFSQQLRLGGGTGRTYYSLVLDNYSEDGISAATSNSEDDGYRNTTFSTRFGHQIKENFGVDLVFRRIQDDSELDAGVDPFLSEAETRQTMFKIEPHWTAWNGRLEQRLKITSHDIRRENDGLGFTLPSTSKGRIFGIDQQNTIHFGDNHALTFGYEYEEQTVDRNVSGFAPFEDDATNQALYIQELWRATDALTLTLGARVDRHEEFGTEPTFRGAAAYRIDRTNTVLRASVGTGFKAPSLTELFDASFGSNNPDLDPEESFGFDVGIEQGFWNDRGRVGVAYFYNEIDDMIVTVFDPVTFLFVNENVEEVETQGAEAFASLEPIENLELRVTYTYTDTQAQEAASFGIREGGRLLRRPLNTASAEAIYRFLDNRAHVALTYLYVGERKDLDPVTFETLDADDYQTVDIAASFRPIEDLRLFGRVENVFDEDYEDVLGFNAPGVGVFGGASYTFGGGD